MVHRGGRCENAKSLAILVPTASSKAQPEGVLPLGFSPGSTPGSGRPRGLHCPSQDPKTAHPAEPRGAIVLERRRRGPAELIQRGPDGQDYEGRSRGAVCAAFPLPRPEDG